MIEELTIRKCGEDKKIIDDPIILRINYKDSPDLTLIDLPGLTRIPIKG